MQHWQQLITEGFVPLRNAIKSSFATAIVAAIPALANAEFKVVITKANPRFGDYQCNNAMALFKQKDILPEGVTSPSDLANLIASKLDTSIYDEVIAAKQGFISVKLSSSFLEELVRREILRTGGIRARVNDPVHACVDYSSPNIAKEMHVGHLRSTIHGESIVRLLEFVGNTVDRVNHVGDWGTQFGMLIEHLSDNYPNFLEAQPALDDLNTFYKEAKARFDCDDDFKARSRKRVVMLQSGDELSLKAWKMLVCISEQEFDKVYKRLDVNLTMKGESYYNSMLPSIVKRCEDAGIVEVIDGAKCILTETDEKKKKNEVPLMIVKSDGGFGYDSTDMAAAYHRFVESGYRWVIIITDKGQEDHFTKIFKAAEMMEWLTADVARATHIGIGLVCGEDGKKFKTRSGDVVKLVDLLDEAVSRAAIEISARRPDISPEELSDVAASVGYAAVKYFDMNQVCTGNYKFSYDSMLDPKGNTAVYLLYTYARIISTLRKAGIDDPTSSDILKPEALKLEHEAERALGFHLTRLTEYLEDVLVEMSMHRVCDFIYELCSVFSEFYEKCRIIGTPQEASRIQICLATAKVMETTFRVLGIKPIQQL